MQKTMKNNEWNVPSDYFENNKKAFMPVRKFPTGKWILALAAACFVGIGLFMWKGEGQTQEIAQGERREEEVRGGKNGEDIGSKHLSTKEDIGSKNLSTKEDIGSKNLSTKEEVAEGLKEIPREELVYYLLEQDSELIENLN
ncbi:MAG: hypothetical protein RLZZ91_1360 [Bacteroidota bacterium]